MTMNVDQAGKARMQLIAVNELTEKVHTDADWSNALWRCVIAFEGEEFQTSGRGSVLGVKYRYSVSRASSRGRHFPGESVDGYGNEMRVEGKSKTISRSTVNFAFSRALEIQRSEGAVAGPKKLGVPGAASYLYPFFLKLGTIVATEKTDEGSA